MLHIAMEIAFAAVVGFGMMFLINASAHYFGEFIIESGKNVEEDWSQVRI